MNSKKRNKYNILDGMQIIKIAIRVSKNLKTNWTVSEKMEVGVFFLLILFILRLTSIGRLVNPVSDFSSQYY